MARGRSIGSAERRLGAVVPPAVRDVRRALRTTQAELGRRCGTSQSSISRLEGGHLSSVSLETFGRLLDSLGIELDIAVRQPTIMARPFQEDAAHARTLGYVARRLTGSGWLVRTEVEVAEGRARGWIDLLAFRPDDRALLVVEVKAGFRDVGAAQRQLAWYTRLGMDVARSSGWSATAAAGALVVLATIENDELLTANRGLVSVAFPGRARALNDWLVRPDRPRPATSIALVDPRSRRKKWLIPLALDGRRGPLRYQGYAEFTRRPASRRPTARRCP